ncbi:leucine-rich repeat-containing protein 3-like [Amphiura filiformis]|uniref:leucine-rich repeat-containing protein 3-like n=1 Tax=Amphiura filiformis TaxID=82378 RepID=UPI003B22197C
MMFSLIYLFPLLVSTVESSEFIFPKGLPCKVYNKTKLDCSNRKLTSVPPLKNTNVRSLDLSSNQLETVNGSSFIHLDQLEELNLSNNSVSNISFRRKVGSRVLDMRCGGYYKILNISTNTFAGLNKLESLDLSLGLQLIFHGSAFRSTTSLKR